MPNRRGIRAIESGGEVVLTVNNWPGNTEQMERKLTNCRFDPLGHVSEGKSSKIRQVGGRVVTHSLCDQAVRLSLVIGYKLREGTRGSKLHSIGETNQVRVSKMQEAGES